ncbi:hypothetical protein QOZ80_9BG0696010 [Eleusine coracana subsp. coracana]|nr:hypothetical protein QOZ80_9BG0696010 [Eleusine coracana subsp. coracana]
MDVDDVFDWLQWGVLTFAFLALVLVVLMLMLTGIVKLVRHLRHHRRNNSKKTGLLSTEQLLASVPDVPYKGIPPDEPGAGDECVICQAAYEVDERCLVLPKCNHMFHKPCIATWLRKHVTCPLCRAIVVALVSDQQTKLNAAAEIMV